MATQSDSASLRRVSPDERFCEHAFLTSQGHIGAQLQRAIQRRDLVNVESILIDMAFVPLTHARELVELYAEHGSPKYERAALRYLERYLTEANPSLADVAQLSALLAERAMLMRGL